MVCVIEAAVFTGSEVWEAEGGVRGRANDTDRRAELTPLLEDRPAFETFNPDLLQSGHLDTSRQLLGRPLMAVSDRPSI